MKIVVIGNGGREHAIIKCIKKSPNCSEIYALPGNGGIAQDAACVDIRADDINGVIAYCKANNIDYVVVAPDNPLAIGMVDELANAGIPAFGPSKAAARIEASKVFAKDLMKKYNIPSADYCAFSILNEALAYVENCPTWPLVVKADGLALGKGVIICENKEQAKDALKSIMQEKIFGDSGSIVVIEEFLSGPEVSVLAFCDGKTLVPMISSMDHKCALDNDQGLNTGGMGTIAPNPYYTPKEKEFCMEKIFLPTVSAMQAEGAPFKGCLYFGLMLTASGPKVIEYNCRFGDPETQVVLPLLQSDLLEIMLACSNGTLQENMVDFSMNAAACVVMASGGYPEKYAIGFEVVVEENLPYNITLYYAGADIKNNGIVTSGGRVLGVTAVNVSLAQAVRSAYAAVNKVHFKNAYYRKDIGGKAIKAQ